MPIRDLPGAPFKVGQTVVVRQPGIRERKYTVMACKPTRNKGWWVSVNDGGYEVIFHESFVFEDRPEARVIPFPVQ